MVIFTEVADYLHTWQDWRKKRQHFQKGKGSIHADKKRNNACDEH